MVMLGITGIDVRYHNFWFRVSESWIVTSKEMNKSALLKLICA